MSFEPYEIKKRSYDIASKYNLKLYPSMNPEYKIDAYYEGKFINSFGSNGMMDYPSYIKHMGKEYADKRRELYYKRHPIDYPMFSKDWLSKKILWS